MSEVRQLAARTRVPREKTDKMLTRARGHLSSPLARDARESTGQNREPKTEIEANGDGTRLARNTRKQISIKEGQANYGKQMKSHVRHLV